MVSSVIDQELDEARGTVRIAIAKLRAARRERYSSTAWLNSQDRAARFWDAWMVYRQALRASVADFERQDAAERRAFDLERADGIRSDTAAWPSLRAHNE